MKKQIVFFCATTPYVMIYKIAREFKKKDYETVLITISQKDAWEESWYNDGFDKIICSNFQLKKPTFNNFFNMLKRLPYLIKAIYEMKKLNPYVIFGIARPNLITSFALRFFKKYPFIYFPYDITSQQYPDIETALRKGIKKSEINAERYCFENSDGILSKGAPEELDFLKGRTILGENIKLPELRINFLPYCSDEFIIPLNKKKLSKKEKEFHLIYAGGLHINREALNSYINIIKQITSQKIHLHIYSKTQHLSKEEDKKNLNPIINEFLGNKYFHIEYAVDPKKLIYETSKYDFGIEMFCFENPHKDNFLFPKFSTGNKISSFFESGFPFFFSKRFEFEHRLLKKYGLDLSLDPNYDFKDFEKKIKKLNYKIIEKKVLSARRDFNIAKHFPRLEKFIDEVVEYHKNKTKTMDEK